MLLIHQMVELANKHGHALHISTLEDLWEAQLLFTVVRTLPSALDSPLTQECRVYLSKPIATTVVHGSCA
jgi:hypothetical protein